MTFRDMDDLVSIMEDHDKALIGSVEVPGIFESEHIEAFGAGGYGPRFSCAATRVDGNTAKVRARGCELNVSEGDSVTTVTTDLGEEWGPYTVRAVRLDGTGVAELQLVEA